MKVKFGIRKPSLKKSISARTTGQFKRKLKRAFNPYYGKKGMGWIRNPKKALYNKIYNKSTIEIESIFKKKKRKKVATESNIILKPFIWIISFSFLIVFFPIILPIWIFHKLKK